jgi:hypothetical protein
MAPGPRFHGYHINGEPYPLPDFDHLKYTVHHGRATRNAPDPLDAVRRPGVDFNQKWYQDRMDRGAFAGYDMVPQEETDKIRLFLNQKPRFEDDDAVDGGKLSCFSLTAMVLI